MKSPYSKLFFMMVLLGTLLTLTSSSWFSAWLGLELNLLSFVPLILSSSLSAESTLKYFLIQACASFGFLQGVILLPALGASGLIIVPLSVKAGMAPFHFWYPLVANSVPWSLNFALMTVQKIAPLYLISKLFSSSLVLFTLSGISAFLGAVGGINELSLRKILAFSSINHLSWVILSMAHSSLLWVLYFIIYMITSLTVMLTLNSLNIYQFKDVVKSPHKMALNLNFLSLGGFPPLLGFLPKWAVISLLVGEVPLLVWWLIFLSVVTLYFYMKSSIASTLKLSLATDEFSEESSAKHTMVLAMLVNFLGAGLLMTGWSSLSLLL